MGDPVTAGAAALSIASAGFSAAGQGTAAKGTAAADNFKAQQLENAAQYGELKATQTGAQMTRNLTMTLSNIDAVRGAQRIDPSSPSAMAVRDFAETAGSQQREITVDNITNQAKLDEASAQYERQAANTALLGGDLGIVGTLLKGGAGAFGAMKGGGSGGGGSSGTGFSLTGTGGLY